MYFDRLGAPISALKWAKLFENTIYRRVAEDRLGDSGYVSTVWIGLDPGFGMSPNPLIFETMVFGGPLDGEMWRYCTEEEALQGHKDTVTKCGGGPTNRIVEV